ncbi:MAG: hypothetical protein Devi2KO_00900 [Devosia indica]
MQEQFIAGAKVLVKRGTIESTGNGQSTPHFSQINGVTFDDGETIRQLVRVESSIAGWLSAGVEGTFVFTRGPGKILMLAAVETEKGLRVTNPKYATGLVAEAAGQIIWGSLFAAMIAFPAFLFMIFFGPIFLILVGMAIRGLLRVGRYASFRTVVKTLDRTRQLPTAAPAETEAPTAVAA